MKWIHVSIQIAIIFMIPLQPLCAQDTYIEVESESLTDIDGNEFKSNNATYDAQLKILKSIGQTDITTSEGYLVETKEVFFNNLKNIVLSNEKTKITDVQKNEIYLDNFEVVQQKCFYQNQYFLQYKLS